MRKLFLLLLVMVGASKVMQAQLTYNFGTTTFSGSPTSSVANINTTAVPITAAVNSNGTAPTFGLNALPISSLYAGASGGFYGSLAAKTAPYASGTSTYVQLVLTPTTGYAITLNAIRFGAYSLTTGPATVGVFTSLNNYLTPLYTNTITTNGTWALINPNQTAISAAPGAAITVRIYFYGGTGAVAGTANCRIDDFIIDAVASLGASANGTLNRLAKFNGSSSLVNSGVTEIVNGNVGIGNATPAEKLDVNGSITTNGGLLLKNAARIQLWNATNGNFGEISSFDGGGFKLKTGGANEVNILNNGNVGLGTSSPLTKLHVDGGVLITGGANSIVPQANKLQFLSGYSSPDAGRIFFGDNSGWKMHFSSYTGVVTDNFTFNDNGTFNARTNIISPAATINSLTIPTGAGANKVLTSDASGLATWANVPTATATAWGLSGNGGTASSNFIGTIDAKDLFIKTNGQQVAKFSGNNSWKISLGILDNNAAGTYSLATGEASNAIGIGSFSANYHTNAEGAYSSSFGYQSKAQGFSSIAFGSSTAVGISSVSSGVGYAYGVRSVAMGDRPLARSFSEIALGMNTTDYTPFSTTAYNASDRLFVVGNGVDYLNPSDALVMLKNGNTGLGTSSPTKKLHLYGTNPSLFIEGDANSFFPELRIKSQVGEGFINNYGPAGYSYGMYLNAKSIQNELVGVGASTTGGVAFTNDPSLVSFRVISTPNQTNDIFKVIQNTATTPGYFTEANALVVNKDGKILMGSMTGIDLNPTTFTHKLAVNGSAIFTKAVVRLTNTWPDFVFEKNYKLPTLAEVEAYIAKHKHLKDVPSAEEVKEKGIDLGDNQTILLKKVEELTLYMIELNKKVEALAKENEELKKKVNGDK
jgi:hypothetical protein